MKKILTIKPIKASVNPDCQPGQLYCAVIIGAQTQTTNVCPVGGLQQTWSDKMAFADPSEEYFTVQLWEYGTARMLGEAVVSIEAYYGKSDKILHQCEISQKGNLIADLACQIRYNSKEAFQKKVSQGQMNSMLQSTLQVKHRQNPPGPSYGTYPPSPPPPPPYGYQPYPSQIMQPSVPHHMAPPGPYIGGGGGMPAGGMYYGGMPMQIPQQQPSPPSGPMVIESIPSGKVSSRNPKGIVFLKTCQVCQGSGMDLRNIPNICWSCERNYAP